MKSVRMMILSDCPYCHQAFRIEEKLKKENPAYAALQVEVVDEARHPEIADALLPAVKIIVQYFLI